MKKSDREIMEILEAFDVTGCAHSAARLAKSPTDARAASTSSPVIIYYVSHGNPLLARHQSVGHNQVAVASRPSQLRSSRTWRVDRSVSS